MLAGINEAELNDVYVGQILRVVGSRDPNVPEGAGVVNECAFDQYGPASWSWLA